MRGGETTVYSPKIDENLIPALYRIGKAKGKPMTRVVNEIITKAIKKIKVVEEKMLTSYEAEKVIYRIAETKKGTGAVTPAPGC